MKNNITKKTIFLDFDGVLFDTVLESYLLARYAFYDISPETPIDENIYKIFHSLRYLITNSWHYFYIMKIIDSKFKKIKEMEKEYHKMLLNRDINADSTFDLKFQNKRKDLINNNYKFWEKLDKPYPFFYKIKEIFENYNILIVSTKNEEAIQKHCSDYGLKISAENITGKNKLKKFGSKHSFLEYYIKEHKIQNAIFIDDCKNTVEDCKNVPNLSCYTANWGYVKAKTEGFSEEDILNKIKE